MRRFVPGLIPSCFNPLGQHKVIVVEVMDPRKGDMLVFPSLAASEHRCYNSQCGGTVTLEELHV